MSRPAGILRRLAIWLGPVLMILLLVVSGFVYWLLTTTPGVRLALAAGLQPLGGQVAGVQGSIWYGVDIERLSLPLEAASIDASDLRLQVNWEALFNAAVQVRELSAGRLSIDIQALESAEDPNAEPFELPDLPVEIQLDYVALGELHLTQEGQPLPVDITDLAVSFGLDNQGARLQLTSLQVADSSSQLRMDGTATLKELTHPWSLLANVRLSAQALQADSPLCVDQYLDTLPHEVQDGEADNAQDDADAMSTVVMTAPGLCHTHADLDISGSMEALQLVFKVQGQDLVLDSRVQLAPEAPFPFRKGVLGLGLADGSGLSAAVDWIPAARQGDADRVTGKLSANQLNISQLAGGALPPAMLQASGNFDALLHNGSQLESVSMHLVFDEGSTWQEAPLEGGLELSMDGPRRHIAVNEEVDRPASTSTMSWPDLHVHAMDVDLRLGNNHVLTQGAFGAPDDALKLQVDAPVLAGFWPGLPGGIQLDALLEGGMEAHALRLDTRYTPPDSQPDIMGHAPIVAGVDLNGSWHQQAGASIGAWLGNIDRLDVDHAGLRLGLFGSVPLLLAPMAEGEQPLWSVGAGGLEIGFQDKSLLSINHTASSGSALGQFKTLGEIPEITLDRRFMRDLRPLLDALGAGREDRRRTWRGRVKVADESRRATSDLALAAQWDLSFYRSITGQLDIQRTSGDMVIPGVERIPLGLQDLSLQVRATPDNQDNAAIQADLVVGTEHMGHLKGRVEAPLRRFADGGFGLNPSDILKADIQADIDDLAWVSLLTGDVLDFGGQLNATATIQAGLDGSWGGQGVIKASGLKVVRIDDGMRLLDGSLAARLENSELIIDELSFPASLRVIPKETRTAEWLATSPDAQDGWLKVTGQWDLADMLGTVEVGLRRFPILQRADRFAMLTGDIRLDGALPALSITGKVTADAGWFDLDMLGGVASVDGDVVVIRGNEVLDEEIDVPMDISMDIEADLGSRFYLTGFGVNSGLAGSLRVVMVDNKLTGMGALRTRGGVIEAYGQRLQLRRGTVTFQGDIANPVLNIEALRTGLAVEAGVRVAGTGRKPRIDLVSYPDVSEVEKLSWLLFGHGPDESQGDMALLVSVGTAFLGGGEPFYRKFGIDEISLRSGDVGSVASVLPAESVVSGLSDVGNDLERQFIIATKALSRGFSVSVRQALSDTGTVGRISYRIVRGVTAELSIGTINGLAFIHRWFSRD